MGTNPTSGVPRNPPKFRTILSLNWLLIFAPVAIVLDRSGDVPATFVFFCAAIAIVPLARLIVRATERVAAYAGATAGGLLNATFGNLPELIIAIAALRAGLVEIVRASIIGALLANLLFAMGLSFLLGGVRYRRQEYNPRAVSAFSSTMVLAWLSLALPSAFHRALGEPATQAQYVILDVIVAILLLSLYGLFLLYSLRTHPETFAELGAASSEDVGDRAGMMRGIVMLLVASFGAAWMSELLVGAAEQAGRSLGMSQMFIGVIVLAVIGGAAETGSAVAMARANRIDLSLGIALGSCVQIALFVAPLLVLLAPIIGPAQFQLVFSQAEMWMLFGAVLLGFAVTTSGHADWFKGAQLLALYMIVAVVLYLIPGEMP
ncbi:MULTISPECIES: calcium/proton exchanger [unclassified Chelatococcus]|uniref:calcium/proton exchanger n=1 Tax=unclassified Chelatococcus TaxID=2638111 RepID=UPI001BCFDD68|nr:MULTISPECIES: calcium/proton exchanger [unclassified Chelatococcus]MBS7696499.1 calcium/proton exchanger [Chelatococcus sp. YT9]MBX3555065.1 calcium/proton exchanger [Chelatococcus sp.]